MNSLYLYTLASKTLLIPVNTNHLYMYRHALFSLDIYLGYILLIILLKKNIKKLNVECPEVQMWVSKGSNNWY